MTNETTASQPTPHQNTLDAITGAIAYGRQGTNPPPSPDHWLAEYWSIGQQLAELGKTSAWDNVTPTASQPKSIGDDAQFNVLADAMCWNYVENYVNGGSAEKAQQAKNSRRNFTEYVDNFRAPEAQASATIQAAPDNISVKVRAIAEKWNSTAIKEGFAGNEVAYELLAALGDFDDAATIQEPVMVADPVDAVRTELGRAAFDAAYRGYSSSEAWNKSDSACHHHWTHLAGHIWRAAYAAPMVADPAGVALSARYEKYMDWCERSGYDALTWPEFVESRKNSGQRHHAPITCGVAATVKAVPSEALDGVVIRKAFICTGCNCVYTDEPVSACDCMVTPQSYLEGEITYFAAPLADKTGGGE